MNKLEYTTQGLKFSWWGGPYIEISFEDSENPFEVFNVWDYEKDEPIIERSMRGLVEYVDENIHDLTNPA